MLPTFSTWQAYMPWSIKVALGMGRSSVALVPCRPDMVTLGWWKGDRVRVSQGTAAGGASGLATFVTRYQRKLEYSSRSATQRITTSSPSIGLLEGRTLRLRKPMRNNKKLRFDHFSCNSLIWDVQWRLSLVWKHSRVT